MALPSGDIRLVQVARMLGLGAHTVPEPVAREAIAKRPADFAAALFAEAAANDDVTSTKAALDYLDGRLSYFRDLLTAPTEAAIRTAFAGRLAAWE
jgi:hypothetical protein